MNQPATAPADTAPDGKATAKPRLDRRAVFLVAIAIFAQESVWNFYDAQVPESLKPYISSAGVIGLIMGLDNIFGIVLQPWMGHLADRYRERRGSRVPFILVGAPLAAVPFVLIPWTTSLPGLLVCVISFALLANSFKGITETLLPDHVPAVIRSRANGFVKIAVSLTIAVSAVISLLVVDRSLKLAFAIPAALMLVAFFTAGLLLHRRRAAATPSPATQEQAEEQAPARTLRQIVLELVRDRDRSRLLLMLGIFCFAGTWTAMRVLLTPYGVEVLGLSRGAAGGIALPGSVAFVLAALPIAYLSDRVGQVRMITYGIAVFIVGLLVGYAVHTPTVTTVAVSICSIGYATFSINAVVALWNLAPSNRVLGVYTGLYTVAQSAGSAAGPALLGTAVDVTGWSYMLLDAAALAAVTFAVFAGLAARNRRRANDLPAGRL
ncbi:MFS transporter [Actinophytocola sp.]|jgi:MFS family permease|uniref:MFS transporter n=1 Tax=Actinophytocola sp. TaxID=1872138 RepID=UPI002ED8575A